MMQLNAKACGARALLQLGLATALLLLPTMHVVAKDLVTASDQTDADKRARVRLELANAYFGRGQSTTALDEVKQAIQINPTFTEAYNLRGLIYASLGENDRAVESFKQALQISSTDADTHHNYGWFLCQQRRYAEATAQFNEALAQPRYLGQARTLLAQGVCQAREGRWDDAERTLARSYELEPANPTIAMNLALVLYERKEFERARFYVRRVNAVPEQVSAQTLWLAARIENRLGNTEGREEFGQKLRRAYPQSTEALSYEKARYDD